MVVIVVAAEAITVHIYLEIMIINTSFMVPLSWYSCSWRWWCGGYYHCTITRDSRTSRQKMVKNTVDFCENWQKSRQRHGVKSNHRPKHHYTVYKSQHLASTTIITCSARFSSVKFCHSGALTNSRNTF